MDTSLRKLTLVCPKVAGTTILDCLDNVQPKLAGYSFFTGQGRGEHLDLLSASEKVQGSMPVMMIVMILPEERIEHLLAEIKKAYRRPQISYWVEPVLDFARLQ